MSTADELAALARTLIAVAQRIRDLSSAETEGAMINRKLSLAIQIEGLAQQVARLIER